MPRSADARPPDRPTNTAIRNTVNELTHSKMPKLNYQNQQHPIKKEREKENPLGFIVFIVVENIKMFQFNT